MAAITVPSTQVLHQPDRFHGKPDKDNFGGDADVEGGPTQAGFSRQC